MSMAMDAAVAAQPLDQPPMGETDHLAAAVLRSLGRSVRNQFSTTPGEAFWLGLFTFGLWPLIRMGRQFREYVSFERQQFWHVAEWLRVRVGGNEAIALHGHVNRMRTRGVIRMAITACVILLVMAVFKQSNGNLDLDRLTGATYRLHRPWFRTGPTPIWKTWTVLLALAYGLHAARVALHYRRVSRFVGSFNTLLGREGVAALAMPDMDVDAKAGWWWTAGILSWFGALWSIPMALAAGMHNRYIQGTSAHVRAEMLERVRAMLAQRRPAVAVPNYVIHSRRCGNDRCRAALHAGAKFCARCGCSASLMSEVA
jgi:hypothetical protein